MYYGSNFQGSSPFQQPQYQKKTCGNGHYLTQTPGEYRNYPSCNQCGTKNLLNTYACSQCNFDLCQGCYNSSYGGSDPGEFQHVSGMSSQMPSNQYQSHQPPYQSSYVEYKQCPNNHFLTLCNSQMRYHPNCNLCGRTSLNHSWTCFNCNYDMCLGCYDNNNSRPTDKVKVCDNGHLLVFTDKYKRPNVVCNKCGKANIQNQYSCYVCDYDECINCYEGRKKNDCLIF